MASREAEVARLLDDKAEAEQAQKVAEKNLEKLLAAEREVYGLKGEVEKANKGLREAQAKLQFWEAQNGKLKAELDDQATVT